jgi:hypothetical protein
MLRVPLICLTAAALLIAALPAASSARSCAPVVNPYPGTEYEGVDLTAIKAKNVGCKRARKVAKGAHRKGLAQAPTPSGHLDFFWRGWDVSGNLRPLSDRYEAARGKKQVTWRF